MQLLWKKWWELRRVSELFRKAPTEAKFIITTETIKFHPFRTWTLVVCMCKLHRIHWIMYTEFAFTAYWVLTMAWNDIFHAVFDRKFLQTHPVPWSIHLSYINILLFCKKDNILSIFQQWPKLTPRWLLIPTSWTPLMSLHPRSFKLHQYSLN